MSTLKERNVYIGTFIDTPKPGELRILQDHVLVTDSRGVIISISPSGSVAPDEIVSSLSRQVLHVNRYSFILPTFTDLHIHPAQYLYAGTGLDLPLMQWLDKYAYRAEERLDADVKLAKKVYQRLAIRLVQNGTGRVLAFGTIKEETNLALGSAFLDVGIRGYVGKLSMDISTRPTYVEASAQGSLSAARSFVKHLRALTSNLPPHLQLIHPVLTPRFVPTCSDELLEGLAKLAKEEGVMVQSHMCESTDQMEWVRATRGKEDEEVFDKFGLLTEKTVQAHVTGLPPKLIDLLHDRQTGIAHCPLSNCYFSDAQFPLREVIDRPLRVGLGSDIAGGYDISIQTQMRQSVIIARSRESRRTETLREEGSKGTQGMSLRVHWKESLYLATEGGAEVLGGSAVWEVGKPFDGQLIDLIDPTTNEGVGALDFFDLPPESLTPEWWQEAMEKWWCVGDVRNRSGVWVQGRRLM